MAAKKNWYAIAVGVDAPIILDNWPDCEKRVKGFKGAKFKGFKWKDDAQAWLDENKPGGKPKPKETFHVEPEAKKPRRFKRAKSYQHQLAKPDHERVLPRNPMPCIQRKSYFCPVKKVFFKNRCVMRQGPTRTGPDFDAEDWEEFCKTGELPWDE